VPKKARGKEVRLLCRKGRGGRRTEAPARRLCEGGGGRRLAPWQRHASHRGGEIERRGSHGFAARSCFAKKCTPFFVTA
jgi:hypothetical protein